MKFKNKIMTTFLVSLILGSSILPSTSVIVLAETAVNNKEATSSSVVGSEESKTIDSSSEEQTKETTEEQANENTEILENDVVRKETMQSVLTKSATIPEFINDISDMAMDLALNNDLYSSVMIAQAILESKYGQSELGTPPVHNLFGIKGMYNGQYVLKDTTEYIDGKPVIVQAKFRKYPSYKESLGDYVNKLKNGPGIENGASWDPLYYSGAWRSNTTNYKDATKFLVNRYASDPLYNQKLDNLIETYQLTKFDTSSSAKIVTNLEAPEAEAIADSDSVLVKGWALSTGGIQKVEIGINEETVGEAEYGKNRQDVYNAYPQYNNLNSGYEYKVNTNDLSVGKNDVMVTVTNTNGQQRVMSSSIIVPEVAPDLPTIFVVDTLSNGAELKSEHKISGWALSSNPVNKIEVIVDNNVVGTANIGETRTDVGKAYPQYKNNNAGFSYTLNTENLAEGPHTVLLRMTNSKGTTDQKFTMKKPAVHLLTQLDDPAVNQSIYGSFKVRGWSLSNEKIENISISVDGLASGNATLGIARADVHKAYPQFNSPNSGYEFNLDTTKLNAGTHTIVIEATTISGKKAKVQRTFTVPNRPNYLIVDTLNNGMSLTDGHIISGWTLSQQKTAKVEILVDDKVLGNATIGIERLDVFRVYPQYANKNAGYQYKLDLTQLTEGKHTLTVRSYDVNGAKQESKFNVEKPTIQMVGSLDTPAPNETIQGNYKIRGWSLSSEKIASIEVLVDGKSMGTATQGFLREDVYKAFSKYNEKNGGYEFMLDATSLSGGSHNLVIETKTVSGKKQQVKTTFKTPDLSYKSSLDTPTPNGFISKDQLIKGWVLNGSAVKSVEVSINGTKIGNAQINLNRSDVANAYPQYNNPNSGFEYKLANQNLVVGSNQVNLKITFMDESQKNINTNVTYKTNLLPVRGVLDEPNDNSGIESTTINVKGWFLAEEGIDKVEIYVDGVYKGRANYGQARTDVNKVYPEYKNSHSGFNLTVDSRSLSNGKHVVKAVATTSVSTVITTETTFTKGSLSGRKIYLDAGHGGTDPGAISAGVQEKVLNLQVALKVQALLLSQGAEVVMSRTGDQFIPLNEISARANASQADIFVSLHHNSATEAAYGIETYSYGASNGRSLSFSLPEIDLEENSTSNNQKALNELETLNSTFSRLTDSDRLSQNIQNGLVSSTGAYDRGAKKNDFHVIRETNMPAILTELGFITNPSERAKLVTDSYQNQLANGVVNGIKVYFSN